MGTLASDKVRTDASRTPNVNLLRRSARETEAEGEGEEAGGAIEHHARRRYACKINNINNMI